MESERVKASNFTWKKDDMSGYVRSIILPSAFPSFIELQNLLFKSTRQSSQITSLSWDSRVNCLPQSIHIFRPLILFLIPFKTGCYSYHRYCYYECRRFYRCPNLVFLSCCINNNTGIDDTILTTVAPMKTTSYPLSCYGRINGNELVEIIPWRSVTRLV